MICEPIDVGDLVVLRTLPDDRIGLVVAVFYERSDDVTFDYEAFFRYAIVEWCGDHRNIVKVKAYSLLKIS